VGKSVKQQLPSLLAGVDLVTPEIFNQLLVTTASTPTYLRRLLREQPVALHAAVEGVRQENLEHLTRTLSQLAAYYSEQAKLSRSVVLESKRHTLMLLARTPGDPWRSLVLLHLNTWLENPAVYSVWSALQKQNAANPKGPAALS
jgi:hypothetical protein